MEDQDKTQASKAPREQNERMYLFSQKTACNSLGAPPEFCPLVVYPYRLNSTCTRGPNQCINEELSKVL